MNRVLARTALVVSLAFLGCGDDDDPTPPQVGTPLTSGVAVTNISGAAQSERMYRITVPSGASRLLISTTGGGTADVDVYVNRGTPPTSTSQNDDCISDNADSVESCDLANPPAGTWYIMIYAWTSYSGVNLTATVTP